MNGNAIETKNLTKRYRGFTLDNVNLTLPRGAVMGLIGENGAGKSTAIKCMLDIVHRDGGEVKLLGHNTDHDLHITKQDIGVVMDDVGIPECLTARQVGNIMRRAYDNWDADAFESYLKKLEIPEKKRFSDFSRGMKMKLGVAVAMSHHAKLLILDEATSGLDPLVRDEVVGMFGDFTRDEECSVLISSHIVSDLEKICDYIAFLHHGRLILCDEKDRLLERYGILRCDAGTLASLDSSAVIGTRESAYGVEALVERERVPSGVTLGNANIEDIFIFTVKGERS